MWRPTTCQGTDNKRSQSAQPKRGICTIPYPHKDQVSLQKRGQMERLDEPEAGEDYKQIVLWTL